MAQCSTTDAMIMTQLKATFGYDSFRPLQHEIVRSLLGGKDVFVLMPTGGGKSLCYQVPALLLDGLAVVVSPLIALMKDQVDGLLELGVPATFINSSLEAAEINRRQLAVLRGEVKLLYVAPERLMSPTFLPLLSRVKLSYFAIDEAHCISEWGHDFRPEYRELARLREVFPRTAFGSFTATATPRVQADIKMQLQLGKAECYQGSFNRPNLFYEVRAKDGAFDQLVAYLRGRERSSGIIYCQSRAGTEALAAKLRAAGFSAVAYHAGLESDERRQRQESFIKDDVQIIVATIAFGMGIDKPDVRFVIHYDLPKNLEGYYQESGRAGRDGDPSDCLLFFGAGDVVKNRYWADQKPTEAEQLVARRQLQQMADWASGITCRRRTLLAYFDEDLEPQEGPCCDICQTPTEEKDFTAFAQMYLSCAIRTGERFGSAHLVQVLRGSRGERVLRLGQDKLSTYGVGRDLPLDEWRHLAGELIRRGFAVQVDGEFNVVKVTAMGKAVLFKGEKVLIPVPVKAEPVSQKGAPGFHQPLFERLRSLRKRISEELGVPPYVVFHDSTLRQMAAELPVNRQHLLRIQGVGERKASEHGEVFLDSIAGYVRETGARPVDIAPSPPPTRRQKSGPGLTVQATLNMFRAGKSVGEIAAERELAISTVEGHLAEAMQAGERIDIERLVGEEKRRAIELALAELGASPLKPVMEKLGDGYTYGEIRFVRLWLLAKRSDSNS
ncbi:MAG: DNA helicase RecQ [Dehalococcoidia bacterium]|nr:DNA helicase RecQ [Dehalococcoidia bacterium]